MSIPTLQTTPIVFDLDGTLTPSDCLWEALCEITLKHPRKLPGVIWRTLKTRKSGFKSGAKLELAHAVGIGQRSLPIRKEILGFLKEQKAMGRRCVLCTASPKHWASEFAQRLGNPFEEIIATGKINLSGENKAKVLVQKFGTFDYVGDSHKDIPVWQAAETKYLAGHSAKTKRAAQKYGIALVELSPEPNEIPWLKALRVHQWAKNLLIFIPLFSAHQYLNPLTVGYTLATFIAFSLVASANYLLNDLCDAGADRKHSSKKFRPIASGEISPLLALKTAGILGSIGITTAFWVGIPVGITLLAYLAAALFYSHHAKRVPILDTTILAALYCIRIWIGGEAANTPVSTWLLSSALFLFFSLGLGKRDAELALHQKTSRGYEPSDRDAVSSLGGASGIAACVLLCLYIRSPEAFQFYNNSPLLWALPTICLFWISRFWLLCGRGHIHDDPVLWASKDKATWLCCLLGASAILLAHLTRNIPP